MSIIQNPILRGFNPDPCIINVNGIYYIATSTFEWYPGVQIFESKDLVNWELIARPLDNLRLLDMRGDDRSGGVWAPCLSHDGEQFYLTYTDVKSTKNFSPIKDLHNYVTVAKDIKGKWSDPIYLNSSGFDPSMFHDDDGRKWVMNPRWDYRYAIDNTKPPLKDIVIQEFDYENKCLIGKPKTIFTSTDIGLAEGPHIYKKDGWYYLTVAEGGTFYGHAQSLARSKNLFGPYEIHPQNPIITSAHNSKLAIQKAGHVSLCEGNDGNWYMVHLGGRPLTERGRCVLGRETSIQKIIWKEDGWLYLEDGGNEPFDTVEVKGINIEHKIELNFREDFDNDNLNMEFQTLRRPLDSNNYSLNARKGFIRLYGKESILSRFNQSLIAIRQKNYTYSLKTYLEFNPYNLQQMAGLILRYDEMNQFYFRVSYNEEEECKTLGIMVFDQGNFDMPVYPEIKLTSGKIYLKADVNREKLVFSYSYDDINWIDIDMVFDISILSDDYVDGFTGAFIGICCNDMSGQNVHADFDFLYYEIAGE